MGDHEIERQMTDEESEGGDTHVDVDTQGGDAEINTGSQPEPASDDGEDGA